MTVGETLLKITDYPFWYSIAFLALGFYGIDILDKQAIPFLTIAGFIGTSFAILDPFGKIFKYYSMFVTKVDYRKLKTHQSKIVKDWRYIQSAFHTKSIETEKDKIVSMFYFLIIVLVATYLLNSSDLFADRFVGNLTNPTCDLECRKDQVRTGFLIIAILILFAIVWNSLKFMKKVEIVATYLFCVGSPKITKESIESISKFIELGDWKTSEYWQERIQEDIKYNKGQRDMVIKAAENIYRPLHEESSRIESIIKNTPRTKNYSAFPSDAWSNIKLKSDHVIIEDTDFRKRIDSFYKMIVDYNDLVGNLNRKVNEIIKEHASSTFEKRIHEIKYNVNYEYSTAGPDLVSCALFKIHPLDYFGIKTTPAQIDLHVREGNAIPNHPTNSPSDFKLFDNMWSRVIEIVETDSDIIKMKQLFEQVSTENSKLMTKYSEKIEMQWKV